MWPIAFSDAPQASAAKGEQNAAGPGPNPLLAMAAQQKLRPAKIPAPPIRLTNTAGRPLDLAQYRGRKVFVHAGQQDGVRAAALLDDVRAAAQVIGVGMPLKGDCPACHRAIRHWHQIAPNGLKLVQKLGKYGCCGVTGCRFFAGFLQYRRDCGQSGRAIADRGIGFSYGDVCRLFL